MKKSSYESKKNLKNEEKDAVPVKVFGENLKEGSIDVAFEDYNSELKNESSNLAGDVENLNDNEKNNQNIESDQPKDSENITDNINLEETEKNTQNKSETLFVLKMATSEKIKFLFANAKENFFLKRDNNKVLNEEKKLQKLQSELLSLDDFYKKEKKDFEKYTNDVTDPELKKNFDVTISRVIENAQSRMEKKISEINTINDIIEKCKKHADDRQEKINTLRDEYSKKIDTRIEIFKKKYDYDLVNKEMHEIRTKFDDVESNIKESEDMISKLNETLSDGKHLLFSDKIRIRMQIRKCKNKISSQKWVKNDLAVRYFDLKSEKSYIDGVVNDFNSIKPNASSSEKGGLKNNIDSKSDNDIEDKKNNSKEADNFIDEGEGEDKKINDQEDKYSTQNENLHDDNSEKKENNNPLNLIREVKNRIPEFIEKSKNIKNNINLLNNLRNNKNNAEIIDTLKKVHKDVEGYDNWSMRVEIGNSIMHLISGLNNKEIDKKLFNEFINSINFNLKNYSDNLDKIVKLFNNK